jgi:hypothetical protein
MKWRRICQALASASMVSAMLMAPASADEIGTVPVSVTVVDAGGSLGVGLGASSGFDFGTETVDAESATGVDNAGTASLELLITGDTSLFNEDAFDITIRLQNGYLGLPSQPVFESSNAANFQIPGRYLEITAVGNPQQAKYTGGSSCANVYDGSATTTSAQCAPREANGNKPIYKVSDPVGLFDMPQYDGVPSGEPNCRIASGAAPQPWPAACPDPSFSDTGSKLIMHFRPGSGTIETSQTIEMTLDIPAGVYPGTYSGTLVVEQLPVV